MPSTTPQMDHLAQAVPLWEGSGFLIKRLHQIYVSLFAEYFAEHSITPTQYSVLSALTGGGLDQITLASAVGLDRSNVCDVVRRLEARELVSRRYSSEDKRLSIVELTLSARRVIENVEARLPAMEDRMLASLSVQERATFTGTLMRLLEANNPVSRTRLKAVPAAHARRG